MKITDIIKQDKPVLSFEVFPPKEEKNFKKIEKATKEIASLKPGFMSVTYGAGGGTSEYTIKVAKDIQEEYGVSTVAHLTCCCSSKEDIKNQVKLLKDANIKNVLALRGDIPKDSDLMKKDYEHAIELIRDVKKMGDFCIGGACYPEGHVESDSISQDIGFLKEKVDAGLDFITTQMFFDNNVLYRYLYKIREAGINVPVFAGIMPITNGNQVERMLKMSGSYLPSKLNSIVEKFGNDPDAMMQAGIIYATDQILDLFANGIHTVHVYSMNKPEVARSIKNNLSNIIL